MTTSTAATHQYSFAVRDIAEFCWRRGDYRFSDQAARPTAKQGQAVHRFLQNKRNEQNPGYQSEVPVATDLMRLADSLPYQLRIRGRIDSLWHTGNAAVIEEIKTTYYQESELPPDQYQVHLAQARLYAALHLREHRAPEDSSHIQIIVTYWHLSRETSYQKSQTETPGSLLNFLDHTLSLFGQWLDLVHLHRCARQAFLSQLDFPFNAYRAGQKALAGACYHQARHSGSLLVHAATGIGKSVSTLFGCLKALAEDFGEQIWYLTAKHSGQQAALQAVSQIQQQGRDLKCLNLCSQQRICFCRRDSGHDEALDTPCDWEQGFHDRKPAALSALFAQPLVDQEQLLSVAREHRVCPHHLAQELLPWTDIVIADFNYVFGFTVRNQNYLERHQKRINLMVDEAHNLPNRSRDNFSANLTAELLDGAQQALKQQKHPAARAVAALEKAVRSLASDPQDYPTRLIDRIQQTRDALETPSEHQVELFTADAVMDLKIQLNQWLRLAGYCESGLGEQQGQPFSLKKKRGALALCCNNPAVVIEDLSRRCRSRVFFSGSLLPAAYFQTQLCRDAQHLVLPSPFPRERLRILLGPLAMGYQHRRAALPEALNYILTLYRQQPGLYLVCAPSYEILGLLEDELEAAAWDIPVVFQSSLKEGENLAQMTLGIAFVVLGGSFAEGVEWPPGTLKGIVILGNGMPGPTREQKRLQAYFENISDLPPAHTGFDYAFLFPGLNRIIQTAGRIQRTEQDAGIVLLLDKRFRQSRYQQHLPGHWHYEIIDSPQQLQVSCQQFWEQVS